VDPRLQIKAKANTRAHILPRFLICICFGISPIQTQKVEWVWHRMWIDWGCDKGGHAHKP